MIQFTNVKKHDVAALVAATYPEYRGRKIRVGAAEAVSLHDLNWSGGTRSTYRACTLDGKFLGSSAKFNAMAPWDRRQVEGQRLPLVPGACVVEHSTFCGQDGGLRIYLHPSDMPWLLAFQG